MQAEKKLYFGPLDTLRTYAFFIVFISHIYLSFFTVTDARTRHFAHGEVGVQIFFVLSAFLITYLSLSEYRKTGTFSVLHFFKKRILRIWPVYFITLFLSYIWHIWTAAEESIGCAYQFLYFMGNMCMTRGIPFTTGSQTVGPMWSVSVEQQFYIIFPLALLAYVFIHKKISRYIAQFAIHTVLLLVFLCSLYIRYVYADSWTYISYSAVASLPPFIAGMYLAYGAYTSSRMISHIQNHAIPYTLSACVVFASAFYIKFLGMFGVSFYVLPIIYATLIFIILAIREKTGVETLFQKVTQHLGKISYGLYAYHMFAIVIMQYFFERTQPVFSSLISLLLTILFAQVSYTYIERFFLKFK